MASDCTGFATSARKALPPISPATRWAPVSSMSTRPPRPPSVASRRHVASPMPDPPPVTSATRPSKRRMQPSSAAARDGSLGRRRRLLHLARGADQLDAQAALRSLELLAGRPVLQSGLHPHAVVGGGGAGSRQRGAPLLQLLHERLGVRHVIGRRQVLLGDLLRHGGSRPPCRGAPLLPAAAARANPRNGESLPVEEQALDRAPQTPAPVPQPALREADAVRLHDRLGI